MRRREFIKLVSSAVMAPHPSFAREGRKVARIGYLGLAPASLFAPRVDALRDGLRDLGWIEGRNLAFEFRWAEAPELMTELAAELVRADVDVIFAQTSTETGAVLRTTRIVPVVFAAHADPVGIGHVASLARPGGNATGITMLLTDLTAKELEVLKEAVPRASKFAVLFTSTAPSHVPALRAAETAARDLGVGVRMIPIRSEDDLYGAFGGIDGVDGVIVIASSLTFSRRALIAELAIKYGLPSVFGAKDNVVAGGLMSYAPDARDLTRRAATYVDRILRGDKPAALPVEQASRYELTINMATARALGLNIPPTLLARADEVIE